MNVLAQEQVQRWIKSKLQGFFYLGYVILRRVFCHKILYYDVTMTYFVTKTLHSTTYTKSKNTILILYNFFLARVPIESFLSRLKYP